MPCYEHFVALQKSVFVPLVFFLHSHLGTGLYYIDSTALATIIALAGTRCLPVWPNAARWAGSSASSCTSSSTTDNEIVALKLTPGNDTTPVPALTRDLIGKLFGDKGSIGQKLAEDLLRPDTVHPRPQEHEVVAPIAAG